MHAAVRHGTPLSLTSLAHRLYFSCGGVRKASVNSLTEEAFPYSSATEVKSVRRLFRIPKDGEMSCEVRP